MTRIGLVRRIILSRQGQRPHAPAWAALALACGILLRLVLDPWVIGVPFLTFFPAVLVATMVLGWGWGVGVLAGAALIANFMFQAPLMAVSLGPQELVATAGFLAFGLLIIAAADALRRAVIELEQRAQRERELNLELQHRVNNTLTVIQALARQMVRHAETPAEFYAAFSERLQAIAEANKVLSRDALEVALMPELAEAAIRPFRGRGVIELRGQPCRLPAQSCVPLVLALHELGTNAAKYGALSSAEGCVRISWAVAQGSCRVTWAEEGGPSVAAPTRRGLGSRLLRRQPGLASVSVTYEPHGVKCEITVDGAALTQ